MDHGFFAQAAGILCNVANMHDLSDVPGVRPSGPAAARAAREQLRAIMQDHLGRSAADECCICLEPIESIAKEDRPPPAAAAGSAAGHGGPELPAAGTGPDLGPNGIGTAGESESDDGGAAGGAQKQESYRPVIVLHCLHIFHAECFCRCQSRRCPTCKSSHR